MHAYLVIGRDDKQTEGTINGLAKISNAKRLDFEVSKIEDVRQLRHFTNLSLNQKTALVIKNLEEASEEAQNAFLKSLEEPQRKLTYIITSKDPDLLLPTIVSRCQILQSTTPAKKPVKNLKETKEFLQAPMGERLKIVSQITKREEAVEFLTNLIVNTEPMLVKNPKLAYFLEEASQTLMAINANGNVSLQLTNFVVSSYNKPLTVN